MAYRKPTNVDFCDILQQNLNMANKIEAVRILITGDLNADPETAEGQKLDNFAYINNLTIHINKPT